MLLEDLPEFEGRRPRSTGFSFSGKSNRRTRPYKIGEKIVVVVEAEVTEVTHKDGKGGLIRVHKAAIDSAYELGEDRAPDLIETLSSEYEDFADRMLGRTRLPFDDPSEPVVGEVRFDEEGVEVRWTDDGWVPLSQTEPIWQIEGDEPPGEPVVGEVRVDMEGNEYEWAAVPQPDGYDGDDEFDWLRVDLADVDASDDDEVPEAEDPDEDPDEDEDG